MRPEPTGTAMVQILASNENETTGTATADANTIVLRCSWDVDCRNTKFEVFTVMSPEPTGTAMEQILTSVA